MSALFIYTVLFIILTTSALNLTRNAGCTTPNNEQAKCIPVQSCSPIVTAISTRNKTAIDFAKKSQCGYDTAPLVCCGTTGYPTEVNLESLFTKGPESSTLASRHPIIHLTSKSSLLPDRTVCGLQNYADRIIGGNVTAIDEYPWMALLRYKNKYNEDAGFKCGGTLINNRYVVTAAHCMAGKILLEFDLDSVRLGEWDYNKTEDCIPDQILKECADPVEDRNIELKILHPYYSGRSSNHDIALLRLDAPVKYTDYIRPICLPPMNMPTPKIGTYMVVAGWGITDDGNTVSSVKLKVAVPITPNTDCENIFGTRRISPNQICAGGEEGKDSCQGDSGGPLMNFYADSEGDEKQWYQEGIVSFGTPVCGIESKPAVYTRTARYLNWILSNLRD